MAEIRTLIVDDEPLARRGVRQLLESHPDIVVVGECRNGREALRAFDGLSPDLVFLDVQMPGLDGFGVLRAREGRRMPFLVFVTAFDEFAVRAFEANALDYLVKPLSQHRFDATIRRVRAGLKLAEAGELAARLAGLLAAEAGRRGGRTRPEDSARRIAVPTRPAVSCSTRRTSTGSKRGTTTPGSTPGASATWCANRSPPWSGGSTRCASSGSTGRRWCGSSISGSSARVGRATRWSSWSTGPKSR